ncbi:MAG: hypothetical protein ACKVZ0_23945 [Gemmatimonadales bacterium]
MTDTSATLTGARFAFLGEPMNVGRHDYGATRTGLASTRLVWWVTSPPLDDAVTDFTDTGCALTIGDPCQDVSDPALDAIRTVLDPAYQASAGTRHGSSSTRPTPASTGTVSAPGHHGYFATRHDFFSSGDDYENARADFLAQPLSLVSSGRRWSG